MTSKSYFGLMGLSVDVLLGLFISGLLSTLVYEGAAEQTVNDVLADAKRAVGPLELPPKPEGRTALVCEQHSAEREAPVDQLRALEVLNGDMRGRHSGCRRADPGICWSIVRRDEGVGSDRCAFGIGLSAGSAA